MSNVISEETGRRLCDLLEQTIVLLKQSSTGHNGHHQNDFSLSMMLVLSKVPEVLTISSDIINQVISHPLIKNRTESGNERQFVSQLLSKLTNGGYISKQGKGSVTMRSRTPLGTQTVQGFDLSLLDVKPTTPSVQPSGSSGQPAKASEPVPAVQMTAEVKPLTPAPPTQESFEIQKAPAAQSTAEPQSSNDLVTPQQLELLRVLRDRVNAVGKRPGVHLTYLADRLIGNTIYNPSGEEHGQVHKRLTKDDIPYLVRLDLMHKRDVFCSTTAKGRQLLGEVVPQPAAAPSASAPPAPVQFTPMTQSHHDQLSSLGQKLSIVRDSISHGPLRTDSQPSHEHWNNIVRQMLKNNRGTLTLEEACQYLKRQARALGYDPGSLKDSQIHESLKRTFARVSKERTIALDQGSYTLSKVR